jgi:putative AlgH/UPF0301 family transcriptional regulator
MEDWRSFRAKLVMSEPHMLHQQQEHALPSLVAPTECDPASGECDLDGIGDIFFQRQLQQSYNEMVGSMEAISSLHARTEQALSHMTPLDPSQWAYDSGKVIEQGAVILGGVEQDFGFGLRQQYFHKAAILVLDHQESTFTKGIILNRPTDLYLQDDLNPGVQWRVMFGGDVQGITSENPDIVCLHSLKNTQATKASVQVMKDVQWTTFDNAKRLVKAGAADPSDFWVFCGYAGWGPGQLMTELDRKSWYMVATDSQTLLKELPVQSEKTDPRDAGLETWSLLMNMIGKSQTGSVYDGEFDDLMLKEWTLQHCVSTSAGGGAGKQQRQIALQPEEVLDVKIDPKQKFLRKDVGGHLIEKDLVPGREQALTTGTLVRASPIDRSPFLLDDQELHKSLVLILSDDDNASVGAILNRPAAKGLDIQISLRGSGQSKLITLPLRFGGQYSVNGSEQLLWLHSSDVLREANIGSPVGEATRGIWKCTAEDVTRAISRGLARPEEFFVVTGVSVWAKGDNHLNGGGMKAEIDAGRFEVVPFERTHQVWNALSTQHVLTGNTLLTNLEIADGAWNAATPQTLTGGASNIFGGLGDLAGHQHQSDSLVFKSDVKVSKLSDDALRNWVATFLLGVPTLGGSD